MAVKRSDVDAIVADVDRSRCVGSRGRAVAAAARVRGSVLGFVSVDQPLSGRRPDDAELAVLMGVADHAAVVLEQAQLNSANSAALREQAHDVRLAAVMLLAQTLDLRHPDTAAHSRTVGGYARSIAVRLELSPERIERIAAAGVLQTSASSASATESSPSRRVSTHRMARDQTPS